MRCNCTKDQSVTCPLHPNMHRSLWYFKNMLQSEALKISVINDIPVSRAHEILLLAHLTIGHDDSHQGQEVGE